MAIKTNLTFLVWKKSPISKNGTIYFKWNYQLHIFLLDLQKKHLVIIAMLDYGINFVVCCNFFLSCVKCNNDNEKPTTD
jgi:hypothetical protein